MDRWYENAFFGYMFTFMALVGIWGAVGVASGVPEAWLALPFGGAAWWYFTRDL